MKKKFDTAEDAINWLYGISDGQIKHKEFSKVIVELVEGK